MKAGLMVLLGSLFATSLSAYYCENYPSSYGYYQNDPSYGVSGYENAPEGDVNIPPANPQYNANPNATRGYFFENRNLRNDPNVISDQSVRNANANNNSMFIQNQNTNQPVSGYYWDNRNMRRFNNSGTLNSTRRVEPDKDQLPTTRNTYSPYGPITGRNM